jgi:hypothetical protein
MQPNPLRIKQTYLERFDEMTLEYRLHFASRLYSWNGDTDAQKLLETMQSEIVPATHEERLASLVGIADELVVKDYERDVNDYARRQPFFEAYPALLLIHNALFRIRHWYFLYDIDERDALFSVVSKDEIEAMLTRLQADDAAQQALSTYAINTFYLYQKLYPQSTVPDLNLEKILDLGASYDRTHIPDMQILIYLYTHCILGETVFYAQPVLRHHELYIRMLRELETLLEAEFENINLDNKCEFLVCAQILGFESKHTERIHDEATRSISSEGFIVDTFNKNRNPKKQDLMMSEHRNVLYIMSFTQPLFQRDTPT